ncbi:hypothetical protein [Psittacicella gerlachiana]|uniref:Peptidase S24/S26A/S26B/S26C domain-containing protein n=1 Tax=Psittacicella gerlachiana TaxID=2028574 RepID=A0A3A1Y2C2_9GAMM|nr:hypothetical protein [Psittacicella gerlachiana]RIY32383.1 hypothetical protein CKF59_07015 [Psittacicella gerlachiana]
MSKTDTPKTNNILVDDTGQAIDLTNYAGFKPLVDFKTYKKTRTLLLEVIDNQLEPITKAGDVLLLDNINHFAGDGVYALDLSAEGKVIETQILAQVKEVKRDLVTLYELTKPGTNYPSRVFMTSQIRFLGKAIGVIVGK